MLIGDNRPHKPAGCDVTSCFRSAAKFNTTKYCTKLRKTDAESIIWPLFNVESPNFLGTSMLTYYTATPVMMLSATSSLHISKLKKRPKMPPQVDLRWILVVQRFSCPTNWCTSCQKYSATKTWWTTGCDGVKPLADGCDTSQTQTVPSVQPLKHSR